MVKATLVGLLATAMLGVLVYVGSRNLQHFDAALVGYTFATLFATFGIIYRYAMWLQRPPTRMYWRRGWQLVRQLGVLRSLGRLLPLAWTHLAAQTFILIVVGATPSNWTRTL